MENNYDHLTICIGYKNVFGNDLTQEELIAIISKYPLSLWLDLFAKIEGFLLVKRDDIPDIQEYLAQAFFLPEILSKIKSQATDPVVYFTLGQLNLLRKLAIAYGTSGTETHLRIADICNVLLGAQDYHNNYDELPNGTQDFDAFCKFIIRNGYLNNPVNFSTLFSRAYQMNILQAKNVTFRTDKSFDDFFIENMGMPVAEATALNFALSSPFLQSKELLMGQTTIFDPVDFFSKIDIYKEKIDSLVESFSIDLAEAKLQIIEELKPENLGDMPIGYDVSIFRKKPLIRLPDGKLVCGNLDCFFQKATQNLVWMPKARVTGLSKQEDTALAKDLTSYRGQLFESYMRSLFKEMESKNAKMSFTYIPAEDTADNEEVGDSILIQDDKLILVEAKSRQFNEAFKNSGDWINDGQFIKELIEKSTEQIDKAVKKIRSGQVAKFPVDPAQIKKVYPVVVIYEAFPVGFKMQRLIRQKVKELGHLTDPIFAPLEIIYVGDLEYIMNGYDTFTFAELLEQKHSGDPHASETSFHNFSTFYLHSNGVISNGWEREQSDKFSEEVTRPNLKFKDIPNE
ncbi:MAG: hypothetical protein KBD26_03085 [Candidatus Pacebacteria bacterium]|nr:hypothetical protein [Candidatus Paceibacterota bacterium]MBP9772791.1 hypothetical protein [Candidatus Paceibacterota bacterium]